MAFTKTSLQWPLPHPLLPHHLLPLQLHNCPPPHPVQPQYQRPPQTSPLQISNQPLSQPTDVLIAIMPAEQPGVEGPRTSRHDIGPIGRDALDKRLLEQDSPQCKIPVDQLTSYFTATPSSIQTSTNQLAFLPNHDASIESDQDQEELTRPVSCQEVQRQLKRLPAQSGPCPNGVPYSIWKSGVAAEGLLSTIYSICATEQPSTWKRSNTVLTHKKGPSYRTGGPYRYNLPSTRSMQWYIGILVSRLASWALTNKKISHSQKCFLPFEGCVEHSFILRSALEDSWREIKTFGESGST